MSINIGNVILPHRVILAPMSGVTDFIFRELVRRFGGGLVVSEMIASRAMLLETKQSMMKSTISKDSVAACVQLAGCEPEVIAQAAKMNEDMGAKIIDLNFGCPAKKVVGGYAGSALMRDEKLAQQILQTTVNSVKIPVTLKMRMGWDENNKNAVTIAKIAQDAGIAMITVHGRTRAQFYSGVADWLFISQVKQAVKIPVIANGDINSFEKAEECINLSGADGIMIGRGTYGKPWFVGQVASYLEGIKKPEPSLAEQLDIVLEHYESMLNYYGSEIGVKLARKHLGWYSSGLPNSSEFRAKINLLEDPVVVQSEITKFYNTIIS